MNLFFLFFIVVLSISGCGPGKSFYVPQNLWNYGPPQFNSTNDYHLTLFWNEFENKIHPIQLAHPEWFIERVSQATASDGPGKLRSYQIVSSAEELYPWIPFWKNEVPSVRADANFSLFVSTSEWKISFQVRTNYQPYPFKASWGQPLETSAIKKLGPNEIQNMDLLYKWIKETEPQIYDQMVQKLIPTKKLFEKWNTYVFFYPGKSTGLMQAFELAKKGEWESAKEVWLKELQISKNDPIIYLNLCAAAQMEGRWDEALEYLKKYSLNKPQGFVWLFSGLPIESEMLEMLRGFALISQHINKKNRYDPKSKIAILLLNNLTNNLTIPDFARNSFLKESKKIGYNVLSLDEVDQKLLVNGFTDGGQLGATTPQALGKLVGADLLITGDAEGYTHGTYRLIYAESGEVILSKKVRGMIHTYSEYHKVKVDKEVEREYMHKRLEETNRTKIISEVPDPADIAARNFFRSWPRLYSK